jgi:hypothetical protein
MEDFKLCKKCNIDKEVNVFRKYRNTCRDCEREYGRKKYEKESEKLKSIKKTYYYNNQEKCKEYGRTHYNENKENNKIIKKEYYEKNKEYIKEQHKVYNRENRDKINKRQREYISLRVESDSMFKLSKNIRTLIVNSFYYNGFTKKSKTQNILGCTFEEFRIHLESKFESWMNWENRGLYNGELNYGWDIDHIIPISSATTEDELIKLNHYKNLQPLCSYRNRHIKKNITS